MNCPIHNVEYRLVPAGISKKSNRAYPAFYTCPVMGCKEKPPTLNPSDPIDAAIAQTPARNDYSDPRRDSDKRSYRIERQHQTEMALKWFELKNSVEIGKMEMPTDEELKERINFFMEDLDEKTD